eukprot:5322657-Pyramimonas_sp.AAC.1
MTGGAGGGAGAGERGEQNGSGRWKSDSVAPRHLSTVLCHAWCATGRHDRGYRSLREQTSWHMNLPLRIPVHRGRSLPVAQAISRLTGVHASRLVDALSIRFRVYVFSRAVCPVCSILRGSWAVLGLSWPV